MSNIQRFVKLDNQYYEVIIGDKGLHLSPVNSIDMLSASIEKTVLGNEVVGLADDDDNVMQKVIDDAREELTSSLKKGIKDAVLGCLGFSKSWSSSKWEIDHCNSRMSTVGDLISHELKQTLLNTEINAEFFLTPEERHELRDAMRKDYKQRYTREVQDRAYRAVNELAIKDVDAVIKDLIGSRKKEIADQVLESLLKFKKKQT